MTAVTVGENAGDVDGVLKLLILESWSRSERVPRVNPRLPTVGTCQRYLPSIIIYLPKYSDYAGGWIVFKSRIMFYSAGSYIVSYNG